MANFSKFLSLINGNNRTVDLSNNSNTLELGGAGLQMDGSTSGHVVISASATTVTYSLIWPSAQAASSGYVLSNDGTGVLSWIPNSSGAVTSLTGDVTGSGPGATATTVAKIQGTTVSGTTGSGNVMFSASPTTTGTLTAAAINASANSTFSHKLTASQVYVTSNESGPTIPNSMYVSASNGLSLVTSDVSGASTNDFTLVTGGNGTSGGGTVIMNVPHGTQNLVVAGNISASNFSGSSSGTNTGDQTITLTGDVTGSGTGSFATTLAATSNATLTTLSALTTASSLASVGTITSGTWNGTTIAIAHGGTGQTSAAAAFSALSPMTTAGDIIYENATPAPARLAIGSTGQVLTVSGGLPVWATPATSGTVTSVAFSDGSSTPIYSVSGSPVTSSGTLTITLSTQTANKVFAGPTSGGAAQPTFRSLVSADIPDLSATYLPLAGGTMSGSINMGSNSITSLATPVNPNDAVNKSYVDNFINATSWKTAVLVATTANITLVGEQTIDGFTTSASRVLVKNQTLPAQNGIYVSAAGAWSRSSDMNSWADVPAAAVFVEEGTVNADIGFVCTSQPGGTLGTTAITWVQFSSAGAYSADGTTLQLVSGVFSIKNGGVTETQIASSALSASGALSGGSGTKLSVNVDGSTIDISGDNLEVKAGGITNTQIGASAAIAFSKLAALTSAHILVGNGSNVATDVAVSGDLTLANTGAFTVAKIAGTTVSGTTGSGNVVFSASPTLTGTITAAAANFSGAISASNFSGSSSGTNTGDQTITLTGDVTGSGTGSFATTIAANAVTTSKINNAAVTAAKLGTVTDGITTDQNGSGSTIEVLSSPAVKEALTAGEAFAATTLFAVRFAKAADSGFVAGRVYKADNDTTSADNFYVIGLVYSAGSVSAAGSITATKMGLINVPSHGFTAGQPLYLGSSGAITATAPSASLSAVERVGIVRDANNIEVQIAQIGVN